MPSTKEYHAQLDQTTSQSLAQGRVAGSPRCVMVTADMRRIVSVLEPLEHVRGDELREDGEVGRAVNTEMLNVMPADTVNMLLKASSKLVTNFAMAVNSMQTTPGVGSGPRRPSFGVE